MSSYTPADFGPGKSGSQFQYLDERLTLHGYPPNSALQTIKDRVQLLQLDLGFTGTEPGGDADGWLGRVSLPYLMADPGSSPVPGPNPVPTPNRIDRRKWKITNPDGSEVLQPEFDLFHNKPWFWELEDGTQVFRAPTSGGATTPSTKYLRSECREMDNGGRTKSAWSSAQPRTFKGRLAFMALPHVKEHAVGLQIHDADDDVMMLRLEGRKLLIESPHHEDLVLDNDYRRETFFDIEIVPSSAGIKVIYNGGAKVVTLKGVTGEGWYYKYGCYIQARAGQEHNGQIVPKDSYAEVHYKFAAVSGG